MKLEDDEFRRCGLRLKFDVLPFDPKQNRPMPVAESPSDLKQLPLYALLAYATRCARRVAGLFRLEPNHPEAAACTAAVEAAIRITEALAAAGEVDPDDLAAAEEGTVRAVIVASEMLPPDERAAYAANSAYAAICAAKAALEASVADDIDESAGRVAEAATIARDSAVSADERVERAATLDWEMLHRMYLGKYPGFGEPVDAAESGMLGPLFQDAQRKSRAVSEAAAEVATEVKDKPRSTTGGRAKARKEPEQHVLDDDSAQQAKASDELKQQAETLKLQQEQLRHDAEQAAVDRAKLLSEVDALRGEVEAERRQLALEREEHKRLCESHQQKVERIEAEQHVVNSEASGLDDARRQIDLQRQEITRDTEAVRAAQQQLEHDRELLSKEREDLKVRREEHQTEGERLSAARAQLETDRQALSAEATRVQAAQSKIEEQQRRANEETAALQSDRERFETESGERNAALAAREAEQARQEDALRVAREEHDKAHAEARRQIEVEKNHLRAVFESLQNERREFLEERLHRKP